MASRDSGISNNLYDLFFLNETGGWVVAHYGKILHTTDGGANWELKMLRVNLFSE